ncbi:hypothetical protein QU38_00360, partial [Staphylococcus aureus]
VVLDEPLSPGFVREKPDNAATVQAFPEEAPRASGQVLDAPSRPRQHVPGQQGTNHGDFQAFQAAGARRATLVAARRRPGAAADVRGSQGRPAGAALHPADDQGRHRLARRVARHRDRAQFLGHLVRALPH